ncbi:Uncharacterised protein [Actinomyces bovis]|uniref:Uncharacterized protein n=1 Tax=Actinomyces bovis TaxID=1658 RepID=A0ABY1VNP2_9ACTO|nr:hypothetical protein [Actinomyces bovis]SPT53731.1 Uncharacterised protein [Actinomyces bovis]VEG55894.1 Uncharacterised protein [Actinomyces israelii]
MSIDTSKLPALNLDVATIRSNASDLKTKAGDLRTSGSSVKTTWGGLSSCYKAPEQDTLYGAMNKVERGSDHLADKLEKIASALSTFADSAASIKTDSQNLKTRADAFLASVASDPDWQYDQNKIDKHDGFLSEANALQVRLWDAERDCANKIRSLDMLAPYHADKQSDKDNLAYGASSLPKQSTGMPWGDPVARKDRCPKKAAVSVYRAGWEDLIMGTFNGLIGLVGFQVSNVRMVSSNDPNSIGNLPLAADADHDWNIAFQTWQPILGLAGFKWDQYGNFLGYKEEHKHETEKEIGKSLAHLDQWDDDPLRAGLGSAIDIGSFFIPGLGVLAGAAKAGKAGSAAAKVGGKLGAARKLPRVAWAGGKSATRMPGARTGTRLHQPHTGITPKIDLGEQTGKWAKAGQLDAPHLPEARTNPADAAPARSPHSRPADATTPDTIAPDSPRNPAQASETSPRASTAEPGVSSSPESSSPVRDANAQAGDHHPKGAQAADSATPRDIPDTTKGPKSDKAPDHDPHAKQEDAHTTKDGHPDHKPDGDGKADHHDAHKPDGEDHHSNKDKNGHPDHEPQGDGHADAPDQDPKDPNHPDASPSQAHKPKVAEPEPMPEIDPRDGIDRGDRRDHRGRYTLGNKGSHSQDLSEWCGREMYRQEMEHEKHTPLRQMLNDKLAARIDGVKQVRYYDGIAQQQDGSWVGIEVKYESARPTAQQASFDKQVSPKTPARVTLPNGDEIKITRTKVVKVTEEDLKNAIAEAQQAES